MEFMRCNCNVIPILAAQCEIAPHIAQCPWGGIAHFCLVSWGITQVSLGLAAHDCGYPLSRYTCRATRVAADFLDFIAFCIGACTMTTKFLDNKISTFRILLSWRFPRKQAFWTSFPLCPQAPPPPSKAKILFLLSSRRL